MTARKLFLGTVAATLLAISSALAQSPAGFIGIEYEGGLEVPGCKDQGGGLLGEPVWYALYKRQDNSYFVLIN